MIALPVDRLIQGTKSELYKPDIFTAANEPAE
jgi:hypothetical protein